MRGRESTSAGNPAELASCSGMKGFTRSVSQRMRRNSVERNMFGIVPIITFAIVPLMISGSLRDASEFDSKAPEARTFFGHAFMPQICRGLGPKYIVPLLCENQY